MVLGEVGDVNGVHGSWGGGGNAGCVEICKAGSGAEGVTEDEGPAAHAEGCSDAIAAEGLESGESIWMEMGVN